MMTAMTTAHQATVTIIAVRATAAQQVTTVLVMSILKHLSNNPS